MIHKNTTFRTMGLLMCMVLLALVWGCSTTRTAELERAQAAYAKAEGDPAISSRAPVPLYEARRSLNAAESAGNAEEQQHYAYLAEKQTQQAIAQAQQKAAEQEVGQLGKQREQIVASSREREAARARAEAQASQQQAETERQRAETSEQRARMSELQAQIAEQQAEQARGAAQTAAEQERLARDQASQLEGQMAELKAKQTSQGNVVLTMGDFMFETNRATLAPGAMLSLDKLSEILKQNPNEKVVIQGHTDNRGTPTYNRQLSQQRAEAVRDALVSRGIAPDRLIARGYGESFPVANNTTEAGRQQNRRVDIVVTG
jgi:outer membrane protein OmpA-like peptidoglycan-associated protein